MQLHLSNFLQEQTKFSKWKWNYYTYVQTQLSSINSGGSNLVASPPGLPREFFGRTVFSALERAGLNQTKESFSAYKQWEY